MELLQIQKKPEFLDNRTPAFFVQALTYMTAPFRTDTDAAEQSEKRYSCNALHNMLLWHMFP